MAACTYCGVAWGDNKDHVIPVSYTHIKRNYSGSLIVPSCTECNNALSNKMFITIPTRASYLLGKYKEKYKRILRMPYWSDEDLEDMSPMFQKQIRANLLLKQFVLDRLHNLEIVSYGIDD